MKTALVIEDDARAATILRLQLESAGLAVVATALAAEGLRLAHERRPDVILLDLMLPGVSGWEALHHLKNDARLAAIPVVILSAAANEAQGLAAGAARVLSKPIRRDDLLQALAEIGVIVAGARRLRLLLAGHEAGALGAVVDKLDPARFELLRAPDADTLQAAAETLLPDLIVLAAAGEAAARLRDSPATFRIPVVAAAGLPADERLAAALEAMVAGQG